MLLFVGRRSGCRYAGRLSDVSVGRVNWLMSSSAVTDRIVSTEQPSRTAGRTHRRWESDSSLAVRPSGQPKRRDTIRCRSVLCDSSLAIYTPQQLFYLLFTYKNGLVRSDDCSSVENVFTIRLSIQKIYTANVVSLTRR